MRVANKLSSASIDIGTMLNRLDSDTPFLLVDFIEYAVIATVGAVKTFEFKVQRLADAMWRSHKRTV